MSDDTKVRVDKWLWSVRIYKTRSQATEACRKGHVSQGDTILKSAARVGPGDIIQVRKGGFNRIFKVLKPIEKRVGAALAVTCYEDLTPAEELQKYERWFLAGKAGEYREKGTGRPTKKERRLIEKLKGRRE